MNNFLLDKAPVVLTSKIEPTNPRMGSLNADDEIKGVGLRARAVSVDSDLLDPTTSLDRKANAALNGFFRDFKFKAGSVEREAEQTSELDSDS